MKNTTQKEITGSPSHNDNRLSNDQLLFLDTHGHKQVVDSNFAHYHFVGAPFIGMYQPRDKTNIRKVKLVKKPKKRKPNSRGEQWFEIQALIDYYKQTEKPAQLTSEQQQTLFDDVQQRIKIANEWCQKINDSRCIYCSSKQWGHWGLNEYNWLHIKCRSCQETFFYHPDHGKVTSQMLMYTIGQIERQQLEKQAAEDPYLAWLLLSQGIEANPGPEWKEDTKRNSKRRQPEQRTRLEHLANQHPDVYKYVTERAKKIQVSKRQQAQFRQQMKALEPKLQLWRIPITLEIDFKSTFDRFIAGLPVEVSTAFKWADIGAAIYLLLFDPDLVAKYAACSLLYKSLGIQAMTAAFFSSMVFHVLKLLGYIGSDKVPRLQGSLRGSSAIAVAMTFVLTLLFRSKPSKDRVDTAITALKDLSPTSRGVELLMSVVETAVNYVKSLMVGEDEIHKSITHIRNRVNHYLSPEGQQEISLNMGSFTELAELQQRAIEVDQVLTGTLERNSFKTVMHYLNNLYRKASLMPVAGHANRKRPVVVHIWGGPGIGKSRLVKLISADVISTILTLDGHTGEDLRQRVEEFEKYVYFSPAGLKHEQNFNAHYSRIYVCDDANQVSPTNKSDGIDFPIKLIALNNNHDHMLPVAELEQKKDARFNSALIIATDNIQSPDLSKSVTSEDAYYRRLDISFEMRLKHKFSKVVEITGGKKIRIVDLSKIDSTKANTHIYEFFDPNTNKTYQYVQFIERIIELLRKVHEQFTTDVPMYKQYALNRLEKLQKQDNSEDYVSFTDDDDSNEEVVYDASQPQPSTSAAALIQTSKEQKEEIESLNAKYDELLEDPMIQDLNKQADYSRIKPYLPKKTFSQRGRPPPKRGKPRGQFVATESHPLEPKLQYKVHFFSNGNNGEPSVQLPVFSEPQTRPTHTNLIDKLRSKLSGNEPIVPLWLATLILQIKILGFVTRIRNFISPPVESPTRKYAKALLTVFGSLVAAYALYRVFTRKSNKNKKNNNRNFIQNIFAGGYGAGDAKAKPKPPRKPPAAKFEPNRIHAKQANEITRIDDLAAYANGADLQLANPLCWGVQKILCSNAYLIQIIYTRESDGQKIGAYLRGFFVKGSIFIVNRHLVEISKAEWQSAVFNLYNIFGNVMNIPCKSTTVVELLQNGECHHDVVAIHFGDKVRDHSDLTVVANGGLFLNAEDFEYLKGRNMNLFTVMINREYGANETCPLVAGDKTAWYAEIQRTIVKKINGEWISAYDHEGNESFTYDTMEYEAQAVNGYCGSVVIMNDPNYNGCIVGIHMAGYETADISYAQTITKEMLEIFIGNCQKQCSVVKFIDREPVTILDKSQFHFLGTVPKPIRSVVKSRIHRTPVYGKIFESHKKPAHLGFYQGKHVVNTAMLKYLDPSLSMESSDMSIFKSLLLSQFTPTRPIKEFDISTAIRGQPGNIFVAPMNRSSSPGYPLCQETRLKGKTEYLGSDENYIVDHPRVLQLIDEYIEDAKNFKNTAAYFVVTPKDELRLIEKVDQGKTRCFAAAPLAYSIVTRMKYLDLTANIMENRISNSSLVGINPYSFEWDAAAKKLVGVAPADSYQFIAGDFSNFDGTLNRDLLWAVHSFMEECYGRIGDPVSKAIWKDLLHSKQLFGNVVVQIERGHPSGHPLTAVLNTLYNAGLIYLCLYKILEEIGTVESFSIIENLINEYAALLYGDDNVIAFSKRLASIIDPKMLPKMMAKLGHVYTTDAKDGSEFAYKSFKEISILKRKFLRDSGVWYAPLELMSIMEPLNWDKIKPHEYGEKRLQVAINMRVAIRELSLHPSPLFDEWSTKIKDVAKEEKISLTPDCFYSQQILRNNLKRSGEMPFLASDDGYLHATLFADTSLVASDMVSKFEWNTSTVDVESSKTNRGMCIYTGDRLGGSPTKESQPNHCLKFRPTQTIIKD